MVSDLKTVYALQEKQNEIDCSCLLGTYPGPAESC